MKYSYIPISNAVSSRSSSGQLSLAAQVPHTHHVTRRHKQSTGKEATTADEPTLQKHGEWVLETVFKKYSHYFTYI
jgi:hypothetical protein